MLSDKDIAARLSDLDIGASNPNFPFDPDKQIQPCSIDLRLSEVFWVPKGFRSIDLSDNTPLGPKVARAFKRRRMIFPKGYLLRPGRFILGRTYESFTIPSDLAGRLVARSSFGRLGLMVATSSNFINPGWHGHMPVVITNNSPFSVRIHPYLSLAQLCLLSLTSAPSKQYGGGAVGSKYIDDEGGPSRYWLDHTISTLRNNLNLRNSSPAAERFLEAYSKELDDTTRQRLVERLDGAGFVEDGADFVESFVRAERRRAVITTVVGLFPSVIFAVLVRSILSLAQYGPWGYAAIAVLALLVVAGWAFIAVRQFGTSMSPGELRKAANEVKKRL